MVESLARVIGSLFGRSAEVAVWTAPTTPALYPEEEAPNQRAVPKRQLEFGWISWTSRLLLIAPEAGCRSGHPATAMPLRPN